MNLPAIVGTFGSPMVYQQPMSANIGGYVDTSLVPVGQQSASSFANQLAVQASAANPLDLAVRPSYDSSVATSSFGDTSVLAGGWSNWMSGGDSMKSADTAAKIATAAAAGGGILAAIGAAFKAPAAAADAISAPAAPVYRDLSYKKRVKGRTLGRVIGGVSTPASSSSSSVNERDFRAGWNAGLRQAEREAAAKAPKASDFNAIKLTPSMIAEVKAMKNEGETLMTGDGPIKILPRAPQPKFSMKEHRAGVSSTPAGATTLMTGDGPITLLPRAAQPLFNAKEHRKGYKRPARKTTTKRKPAAKRKTTTKKRVTKKKMPARNSKGRFVKRK